MPQCVGDTNDFPSDDINVCFVALVDGALNTSNAREFDSTEDDGDDMSDFCANEGWNLEFILKRREGFPAPGGTAVKATCQLSSQKAIDCPQLN